MTQQLKCECGKTLSIPDHLAGKKAKCPCCQSILTATPPVIELKPVAVVESTPIPPPPFPKNTVPLPMPEPISKETLKSLDLKAKRIVFRQEKYRIFSE